MKKSLIVLILFAVLIATISVKVIEENKNVITVSITFDTEYPYGITSDELKQINEQEWISTLSRLENISKNNDVKFQFNVLGKTAEKYPNVIKELSLSQDISCHTYSHLNQTKLNYSEKETEIKRCKEAVESVTSKKVIGNRFPYTKYDNESLELLKRYDYKWDSSAWATSDLKYYNYDDTGITEFPIPTETYDWEYFIQQNRTDAKEFYDILYNNIINRININSKNKKEVYVVVLHDWVLSIDKERADEFDNFIKKIKKKAKIKSLDGIYGQQSQVSR